MPKHTAKRKSKKASKRKPRKHPAKRHAKKRVTARVLKSYQKKTRVAVKKLSAALMQEQAAGRAKK